ncbi:hypothetical protein SNEBB_005038 [Seison nebaliae]|nr:hypothetical protein SNEBB_005038 [Seison nebaliae]
MYDRDIITNIFHLAKALKQENEHVSSEKNNLINYHTKCVRNAHKLYQKLWISVQQSRLITNLSNETLTNQEFSKEIERLDQTNFQESFQSDFLTLFDKINELRKNINVLVQFLLVIDEDEFDMKSKRLIIDTIFIGFYELLLNEIIPKGNLREILNKSTGNQVTYFYLAFRHYSKTTMATRLFLSNSLNLPILTIMKEDHFRFTKQLINVNEKITSKLVEFIKMFIKSINDSSPTFPNGMKCLLRQIYKELTRQGKLSKETIMHIIVDLLMGQYICRALNKPEQMGISHGMPLTENAKNNLFVISNFLRTLCVCTDDMLHTMEPQSIYKHFIQNNLLPNFIEKLLESNDGNELIFNDKSDLYSNDTSFQRNYMIFNFSELQEFTKLLKIINEKLNKNHVTTSKKEEHLILLDILPSNENDQSRTTSNGNQSEDLLKKFQRIIPPTHLNKLIETFLNDKNDTNCEMTFMVKISSSNEENPPGLINEEKILNESSEFLTNINLKVDDDDDDNICHQLRNISFIPITYYKYLLQWNSNQQKHQRICQYLKMNPFRKNYDIGKDVYNSDMGSMKPDIGTPRSVSFSTNVSRLNDRNSDISSTHSFRVSSKSQKKNILSDDKLFTIGNGHHQSNFNESNDYKRNEMSENLSTNQKTFSSDGNSSSSYGSNGDEFMSPHSSIIEFGEAAFSDAASLCAEQIPLSRTPTQRSKTTEDEIDEKFKLFIPHSNINIMENGKSLIDNERWSIDSQYTNKKSQNVGEVEEKDKNDKLPTMSTNTSFLSNISRRSGEFMNTPALNNSFINKINKDLLEKPPGKIIDHLKEKFNQTLNKHRFTKTHVLPQFVNVNDKLIGEVTTEKQFSKSTSSTAILDGNHSITEVSAILAKYSDEKKKKRSNNIDDKGMNSNRKKNERISKRNTDLLLDLNDSNESDTNDGEQNDNDQNELDIDLSIDHYFANLKKKIRKIFSTIPLTDMSSVKNTIQNIFDLKFFEPSSSICYRHLFNGIIDTLLSDCISINDRDSIVLLHETKRIFQLFYQKLHFDNEEIEKNCGKLLEELWRDYENRFIYITYLSIEKSRLLSITNMIDNLLNHVLVQLKWNMSFAYHELARQFIQKNENCFINDLEKFRNTNIDDDKSEIIQRTLQQLYAELKKNIEWRQTTNEQQQLLEDAIERQFMSKIYIAALFPLGEINQETDMIFSDNLKILKKNISPSHPLIDIPKQYHGEAPWLAASMELSFLSAYKTPSNKLSCIESCANTILHLLTISTSSSKGADDCLPILVYIIVMTNPENVISTIRYIDTYYGNRMNGEKAYWWILFKSAIEYIRGTLIAKIK